MSKGGKYNLNTLEICSLCKKKNHLDMADCIKVAPLIINNISPIVAFERQKAKNVIFAKQLRTEARKAKLQSLYGTDDPEKIKPKTRRKYIEEFVMNTLNDNTFISIN